MKQILFLSILIATCFMFSCKKEANGVSVTYALDSVKIENLNANDSIVNSFIVPVVEAALDSLTNPVNNIAINGDSLNIRNYASILCGSSGGFYVSDLFSIINGKPIIDSSYTPNGSCGQYGNTINKIRFSYSNSNKLMSINTFYDAKYMADDYVKIGNSNFNYTGNELSSFTKHEISFRTNGMFSDTLNSMDGTYYFSYPSGFSNQSNLIGFDCNDLVLSSFISGLFYFDINSSGGYNFNSLYNVMFSINKLSSFNTKCDKLIEDIQFDRILQNAATSTVNINVQYTFDPAKNNRIKTMKITNDFGGNLNKILYTFYYKE